MRKPKGAPGRKRPATDTRNRSVMPREARDLLRHALATGDAETAALVAWLIGRAA